MARLPLLCPSCKLLRYVNNMERTKRLDDGALPQRQFTGKVKCTVYIVQEQAGRFHCQLK